MRAPNGSLCPVSLDGDRSAFGVRGPLGRLAIRLRSPRRTATAGNSYVIQAGDQLKILATNSHGRTAMIDRTPEMSRKGRFLDTFHLGHTFVETAAATALRIRRFCRTASATFPPGGWSKPSFLNEFGGRGRVSPSYAGVIL